MNNVLELDYTRFALVVDKTKMPFDVYIGRGSRWGNRHRMAAYSKEARVKAVLAYANQLTGDWLAGTITSEDINSLRNKTLGCFCYPRLCHGMVLAMFGMYLEYALVRYGLKPDKDKLVAEFLTLVEHFVSTYTETVSTNLIQGEFW